MAAPRQLVLGTAGHIDHGKTALVRALTGVDTDRLPAEKLRGITIDLGFAAMSLGDVELAVVDVPGHERFVRNMLAGATGLDLALLVVAADDSVMPQTREHLEILRLLGLSGGVIALTKCDLVEPDWLAMVEDEVRLLVRGTFLEDAPIVRTSAQRGTGIADLRARLRALAESTAARSDPGPFRLAVDRAFTVAGHGTVLTGTVASGNVAVGDELEWLPARRSVRVRGLQRHGGAVDRLGRGTRAAINVVGVHHAEVARGQELATPGYLVPTRWLTAEVQVLAGAPWPLRHRGRYRLHLGTADVGASLSLFGTAALDAGQSATAQIVTSEPVAAVHGQPFVLRAESPPTTLGGGRVLQPSARRIRRRDAVSLARVEALRAPQAERRAIAALGFRGIARWAPIDLVREAGLRLDEVAGVLSRLKSSGALVELHDGSRRSTWVPAEYVEVLEDRLRRAVGRRHQARPRQSSIPRTHLAAVLPDLPGEFVSGALVDRLLAQGDLVGDSRTVALRDFTPQLSQAERKAKDEIAGSYQAAGFSPPDLPELLADLRVREPVAAELLALLVDERRLVEVARDLYLDAEAEATLRERVATHLANASTLTMAELRDLLGITRKHAVPLGEYLDRIGLTYREGDARRLRVAPETTPGGPR